MCESCKVMNINGVNCHEYGCPDARKRQTVDCHFCGYDFVPGDDGSSITVCPACNCEEELEQLCTECGLPENNGGEYCEICQSALAIIEGEE